MAISLPNYVYTQTAPHMLVGECVSLYWEDEIDGFSFVYLRHVMLQRKAQTQQAREFHTKSIKEKAVHLSWLFSEESSAVLKVTISSLMCDPHPGLVFCTTCPPQCVYLYIETRHVWDDKYCMQPVFSLVQCFVQHLIFFYTWICLYVGNSVNAAI